MKTSRYFIAAWAAAIMLPLFSSCMPMLDTSLSMSPAPGVNVGVGVSTPIPGPWSDGPYSPFWGSGIAGIPAWGLGPSTPPPPPRPVEVRPPVRPNRPVTLPSNPVVPPAGTVRPYPTGPGPVVGGTGLPTLRPGAAGNGGGGSTAVAPPAGGGSFRRPYLRNK